MPNATDRTTVRSALRRTFTQAAWVDNGAGYLIVIAGAFAVVGAGLLMLAFWLPLPEAAITVLVGGCCIALSAMTARLWRNRASAPAD